ncbi:MAG: D-glycero-beta-D-manno-heptose-7-phosphate kinase [Candidatus Omnitrophota bacterium]
MERRLSTKKVGEILKAIKDKRILVVGDLMLDRYLFGKVERISPEAPVPIFLAEKEEMRVGGAGNVASNIKGLGGRSTVISFLGDDTEGSRLKRLLKKQGVELLTISVPSLPTIAKTRVMARNQQLLRIDQEDTSQFFSGEVTQGFATLIKEALPKFDALIISDYGKGVINRRVLNIILPVLRKSNKIVTVDPKVENFLEYRGVDSLTPNLDEASAGIGSIKPKSQKDVEILGFQIIKKLEAKSLLITQGAEGMTLFQTGYAAHIPTAAREVFDVTGAGDTVIAAFTLALTAGFSLLDSAEFANLAAGIVISKLGTATVTPREILKQM